LKTPESGYEKRGKENKRGKVLYRYQSYISDSPDRRTKDKDYLERGEAKRGEVKRK
jgi:hypothetical protein